MLFSNFWTESLTDSVRGETHLKMALQEPLSSLQPEFKQEGVGTFTNCLLLHRLLITGQVPEYFIFLSYLISSSPGAGGGGAKEEAGALPLPPLSHLRVHISWFEGEILSLILSYLILSYLNLSFFISSYTLASAHFMIQRWDTGSFWGAWDKVLNISMLERSLSKDTWQVFSSPKYFDKNIIRWIAIV